MKRLLKKLLLPVLCDTSSNIVYSIALKGISDNKRAIHSRRNDSLLAIMSRSPMRAAIRSSGARASVNVGSKRDRK